MTIKCFLAPILENSFSEINGLTALFSHLKISTSGKVALDIGGNIGMYASSMLMAGFEHVHIFEPNTEIKHYLENNLHNFDDQSYTSHYYGIAQKSETLKLSAPNYATKRKDKKFDLYNLGTKSIFGSGQNAVECNFLAYNDIPALKNLKHCDLIKIDVEGAELEVVKAITLVIKKFKPLIMVELNPNYIELNKELLTILKSIGYKTIERTSDQKIFNIYSDENLFDGKDYVFSV